MDHITTVESCRICHQSNFETVINLGDQYIANAFYRKENPPEIKAPLHLMRCINCGLVQLAHSINCDMMYRNYWYKSSINHTMREHLQLLVKSVLEIKPLRSGDTVIDVGCNDQFMLGCYPKDANRVGVDPSNVAKLAPLNCNMLVNDYFSAKALNDIPKAKIITSIAMFYDLNDPKSFVQDVRKCLADDGIWVLELAYLPLILSQNCYDTVCVKPDTTILGSNKKIVDLTSQDYALNENGVLVKISKRMERTFNGNLIKIRPRYLESISITAEHPIKIVKKETIKFNCGQFRRNQKEHKFEWVQASKVRVGDYMVIPRLKEGKRITEVNLNKFNQTESKNYRFGLKSIPLNKDTAWLFGLYVAEGYVGGKKTNRNIEFSLNITEESLSDRINEITKTFGYKSHVTFTKGRNTRTAKITCAALARSFREWFGDKANRKKIPDFIMTAPKDIKIAFLRGLFVGDGFIDEEINQVHYHTSSKVLALQVQLMVASLGGMLGISYVKPYPRTIRGRDVHTGDSWQLRGRSRILAEIFDYKYTKGVGECEHNYILKDDYVLIPIMDVGVEKYNGKVYNIETDTHTYLVSNAVVHNCHEHVCYYSLTTFELTLVGTDLEVFKIEKNNTNGGSFRLYVAPKGSHNIGPEVQLVRNNEKELEFDKPYREFAQRITASKNQLISFLKEQKRLGKKVYGYGASTKGQVTMQYCEITSDLIVAVAERNPDKYGLYTPGTNARICSEEEMRKARPDFLVIFPWHFLEEFVVRERTLLMDGTRFVVPLPKFDVIYWQHSG